MPIQSCTRMLLSISTDRPESLQRKDVISMSSAWVSIFLMRSDTPLLIMRIRVFVACVCSCVGLPFLLPFWTYRSSVAIHPDFYTTTWLRVPCHRLGRRLWDGQPHVGFLSDKEQLLCLLAGGHERSTDMSVRP